MQKFIKRRQLSTVSHVLTNYKQEYWVLRTPGSTWNISQEMEMVGIRFYSPEWSVTVARTTTVYMQGHDVEVCWLWKMNCFSQCGPWVGKICKSWGSNHWISILMIYHDSHLNQINIIQNQYSVYSNTEN